MTQALADAFATGIAEHPEDWHMLQRLWLKDLDPGKNPDNRDSDSGNPDTKDPDNAQQDSEKRTP
jgi:KDO2-lipid IV(A) lauroyltransferase